MAAKALAKPAADELATAIGAAPIKPPLGWATARELVPDAESLRRLLKLGGESPQDNSTRERFTRALTDQGPLPSVQSVGLSLRPNVGQAKPNPVTEARSRLAKMSLEEQAAALLTSMTNDGRVVSYGTVTLPPLD